MRQHHSIASKHFCQWKRPTLIFVRNLLRLSTWVAQPPACHRMKKWGQIPTWLRKGRVQHQIPAHELRKLVAVHCVIPSVEHCGIAVLPALATITFFITSVALHVFKVMASCTRCLLFVLLQSSSEQDTFASSVSWRAALRLSQSSVCVMFGTSVLPTNRCRVLNVACPNTQSRLVLVSHQESTDACAAVSRPERSSGRLSRRVSV